MLKVVLLVAALAVARVTADSCKFVEDKKVARENRWVLCEGWGALRASGPRPSWRKLIMQGPSNGQPLGVLRLATIRGVPLVRELVLRGTNAAPEPGALTELRHLHTFQLEGGSVSTLGPAIFSDTPIVRLLVSNAGVRELLPRTFEGMTRLRRVYIADNNIQRLSAGVFCHTQITHLSLPRNRLRVVEPNALGGMFQLRTLNLDGNDLVTFDSALVLGYSGTLLRLILSNNHLTRVGRGMFASLPELTSLSLRGNGISTLVGHTFHDLYKLQSLDLSDNQLRELPTGAFPPTFAGLTNLNTLFLQNNWLGFLAPATLRRLPALRKLGTAGNPWQCPCWRDLNDYAISWNVSIVCEGDISVGRRPACVRAAQSPTKCVYNTNAAVSETNSYLASIANVIYLPSFECSVRDDDKDPYYDYDVNQNDRNELVAYISLIQAN